MRSRSMVSAITTPAPGPKLCYRALTGSCRVLVAAAALVAAIAPVRAATLNWDPLQTGTTTSGGTGFWDLSTMNWFDSSIPAAAAWNNTTPDSAVFGGPSGTVFLLSNITAGGLAFNTNGYALDLQGFNLTNTGVINGTATLGNITFTNTQTGPASTLTVASLSNAGPKLSGNMNVTITGTSGWTPAINHDFTGTLWLQTGGTVTINANGRLGSPSGLVRLDGSTTLTLQSTTSPQAETYTRNIELDGTAQRIGTTGVRNITLAGQISGSGNFTQTQTQGMLTLEGSNTYTGATNVISAGPVLAAANDNAFGNTSGITLSASAMLAFKGDADGSISVGAIPLALNAAAPTLYGLGMVHNLDGTNSFAGNITGTTTPKTFGAEANSSLTLTGNITYSRGFTKLGLGTLVLSGANTYGTGNVSNNDNATVIDQGTLRLDFSIANLPDASPNSTSQTDIINHGNANITGNTSSELILAGGTLEIRGAPGQANGQRFKDRIAGTSVAPGLGFRINAGASAVRVDQNGAASVFVNLGRISLRQVGGTLDLTLPTGTQSTANGITVGSNPNINGIHSGFITINGTDWATTGASGTNPITPLATYTNDTWAPGTNTTVTTSATIPSDSTTNSLRFHAPGANTLTLAGANEITSGGLLVTANVGANQTKITGGSLSGTVNAGTSTYITGNYSSDLIVHQYNTGGSLVIESVIADSPGTSKPQPTTFANGTGVTTITLAAGSNTRDLYVGMPISGTNIPAGAVVSEIRSDTIFVINAVSTGSPASGLTFTGTSGLTKTGPGVLELAGGNTYTGATTVTGGMLKLSNASALGSANLAIDSGVIGLTAASGDFTRGLGANASQVQFLSGGGFAAYGGNRAVNLGGSSAPVLWGNTLSADGSVAFVRGGSILILGASDADGTLDFQNPIHLFPNNTNVPLNRTVEVPDGAADIDARLSGIISTEAGFTKSGGGTLDLSAVDTYTGPTIVQQGTLQITGSLAAASQVSVQSGATLRGTGSLGPLTLTSGATLAPGVDIGTLTTGSVVFNGGTLSLQLGGSASFDQLNVLGTISFNAPIALSLSLGALPFNTGVPFTIVSNDGADVITFADSSQRFTYNGTSLNEGDHLVVNGATGAQEFVISYSGGTGNDVTLTPVPEPGTPAALLAGLGLLVACQRLRKRPRYRI